MQPAFAGVVQSTVYVPPPEIMNVTGSHPRSLARSSVICLPVLPPPSTLQASENVPVGGALSIGLASGKPPPPPHATAVTSPSTYRLRISPSVLRIWRPAPGREVRYAAAAAIAPSTFRIST